MATHLRFRLTSGVHGVPLARVYRVAGFASLTGEPQDYFIGWLKFQGKLAPVFDLNQVVCEEPTPERFGSRIILVAAEEGRVPYIGLLAPGVTDTAPADDETTTPLDLDMYLGMLTTLIPEVPAATR
ncbi:MAG TPA: chemotaxis protein CheW [Terracidiphilus sp.]|nr:chemotaxis protein CheW [Terracidiphilus sp.]